MRGDVHLIEECPDTDCSIDTGRRDLSGEGTSELEHSADHADEVARLVAGDATAWEALYGRVYPAMLAYADRRLGGVEDARDAVSEAMSRAVASVERMAALTLVPEAWLFGILRHVVIDQQRRTYRTRDLPIPRAIEEPGALDGIVLDDEQAAVKKAFARLSDKDRELLELRVVAGLSSDEVASVLGMQPGAVRMAQARALGRLRGHLATLEGLVT
jgi:RNA polymerase sigma-70 factor (ECF subfamily)